MKSLHKKMKNFILKLVNKVSDSALYICHSSSNTKLTQVDGEMLKNHPTHDKIT